MKWVILLTVALASSTALVSAQPTSSSVTSSPPHARANSSNTIQDYTLCDQPAGSVERWYYNTRNDGPYYCYNNDWTMLNAYRSGGTEGVHWKYTDNVNDPDCLVNWEYYAADGTTLYAKINGRTTTERDPRRWCALPVYRKDGIRGKQWEYCDCTNYYS